MKIIMNDRNRFVIWLIAIAFICGFFNIGNPIAEAEEVAEGVVLKAVYLRSDPSMNSQQIRTLHAGEQVKIFNEVNNYWYKIKDQYGTDGYVSSQAEFIKPIVSNHQLSTSAKTITSTNKSSHSNSKIDSIIKTGLKYLGTPYEFGSDRSKTTTFDCSAFVRHVFKEAAGIVLPSDSRQQANYVKNKGITKSNWRSLQKGDLMFFMSYRGTDRKNYSGIDKSKQKITHVGIYMGDGKILHTYSKESGGVRIDRIAGTHWEYRFIFGGSALK